MAEKERERVREREKERRLPSLLGLIAEQVHRNVSPSVHLFPMRPRPPDDLNQPGNRQSWTPHGCRRRPTAGLTRARASPQERKKVTEARLFFFTSLFLSTSLCFVSDYQIMAFCWSQGFQPAQVCPLFHLSLPLFSPELEGDEPGLEFRTKLELASL